MYTLFALVLTAAAVVIARPPVPGVTTAVSDDGAQLGLDTPTRKYLRDYILPRYLWPHYVAYEDNRVLQPQLLATDWLNKEIERLTQMQVRVAVPYKTPSDPQRMHNLFMKRLLGTNYQRTPVRPHFGNGKLASWDQTSEIESQLNEYSQETQPASAMPLVNNAKKTDFALTPLDEGYFEPGDEQDVVTVGHGMAEGMHEGGGQPTMIELEPPRQTRQNPNRNKNLIASNLDKLNIGLSNKEYRLPVSLLPSNLRWLKHYRSDNESGQDSIFATEKPRTIRTESIEFDGGNSFYGVAVMSAIGAAVVMAVVGFGIGWYTLSKRAKAAADVDYPAYGVTGPTIDSSGDRKLAHSAHMYHYQHQKQQIIAMERNGMPERNGSVSDPESEDENEEGDYTVYECPGFATTGEMEVKNPLFNDDPTPATPGKCELVKPQPKD